MRSLHTAVVALLLVAAVPAAAHADDVTRRAKAEQMLALTHTDALLKQQLDNVQERVQTLAKEQSSAANQTPEQQKLTADYLRKVSALSMDAVGWDKVRPVLVQSYAETFTDAELDAIIVFYKSPAGESIVAKAPELSQKTVSMVQASIKELQPKLAQLTQDYATQMQAAAPAAKPAAAPSAKPAPATPASKK